MTSSKQNWLLLFRKFLPGVLIALVIIATSWSLATRGFFFAHDMLHLARSAELWRALAAGQFPPRWSQNFGFGYGIPLFEFYAPLPYIFGALAYGIHVPDIFILKLLYFLPNVVSAVGAYLLGKHLYGKKAGVLLAVAFALAPYRSVDLFVRGAISESWGIMTFPWILYGISLMVHKANKGILILLFSCVALFLSHNITTLLFMPLAVGFGLVELFVASVEASARISLKKWLMKVSGVIGTVLLAVGASAFYLLPAFLEKQFVQIQYSIDDYYQYTNHFLYLRQFVIPFWGYGNSVFGPNDTLSFFLGYGWWACAAIGAVIAIGWLIGKILQKSGITVSEKISWVRVLGWGTLSLVSLGMTLGKSSLIWAAIPPLQFAQFPWRYLGCFAIFSTLTFVAFLSLVKSAQLQAAIVVGLVAIIFLTQTLYFQPTQVTPDDPVSYGSSENYIRTALGPSLLEYLPNGVPSTIPVAESRLKLLAGGSVTLQTDKVGNYQASITSPSNSQVIWQVANFPGWTTTLDGQAINWTTNQDGLISIPVPSGTHEVTLKWGETPIRFISDLISAISWLMVVALIWTESKKYSKRFSLKN